MNVEGKQMSYDERKEKYGSVDNPKYLAFKDALAPYFTQSALRQVHHSFSSKKNESLNQKVMQFAPKDKHYSGSFSLYDRLYLVVIEDLIELEAGLKLEHDQLGIETNLLFTRWCQRIDSDTAKRRTPANTRREGEENTRTETSV
jgi:hypothetical protein